MRARWIKIFRCGASLGMFLFTGLLFVDFRGWLSPAAGEIILYPQFVPSLLRCAHGVLLEAGGWIVVLMVTLCIGRIYCSFICPLGTLQDLLIRFVRVGRSCSWRYRSPYTVLRYSILVLTVVLLLSGKNLLLNLFDPFSIFGRMMNALVRPVVILFQNTCAVTLEHLGIFFCVREHLVSIPFVVTGVAMTWFLLVLWLAMHHGRLYCNAICPVGTLLGLVSNISFLGLRVDDTSCIECRKCVNVCKAECIDLETKTVDMSRCVGCFNCLAECKMGAISYTWRGRWIGGLIRTSTNPGRRHFFLSCGVTLLALGGWATYGVAKGRRRKRGQGRVPDEPLPPILPPGAICRDRFIRTCTACHLCVSGCPSQILLPVLLEYGVSGFMQPKINFQGGYCTYECTLCGNVCPTGAIQPLKVEQKKLVQIGRARFYKKNCVVMTDKTACGACAEHCPTKAVHMVPYGEYQGRELLIPELNDMVCIGCGACEYACPSRPWKAIRVQGNSVQAWARAPVVKKMRQEINGQEDFPF